ncbi:non-specific lipid transfer protein GPI-anchored 20-like [Triticum urartu]|uniref:non-specific lipid transfer protein GPI-anchored 20-like n=1 Tax=Triticum urartu TaxID=4572 RepID=UPI0020449051|nr:non-specific lipid transfer protein GPI-anchored 20-like [Triticum urartu]
MDLKLLALAVSAAVLLALALPAPASGQAASCTASLVSSFTPCLGYITNSTSSTSPTVACCRSLSALVNASTGCACLLLTGSVPLGGVPVNRTLAVTLPRACNSMAVPLQCKDASAQLPAPAPGPVATSAASPAMPPLLAPASPSGTTVATPPAGSQSQGQTRPQVAPSSAWRDGAHVPALFAAILAVGAMLV